jgi:hypothetical protein
MRDVIAPFSCGPRFLQNGNGRKDDEGEAMPAEATIETNNSILEVGTSMLNAVVLAFSPRGPLSSGPSSVPVHALSSARSMQAAAKQAIPETPTEVEPPTLKPESDASSHLVPPPPHRHSMGPTRPDALDNGDETNLDISSLACETMSGRKNPSSSADKPSLRIVLDYTFQGMWLLFIISPIVSPIALPSVSTFLLFGVHVYLHGLLAMPLAVHLCILPVTLIICIVTSIVFWVEMLYLPFSLVCLIVGIRLGSCRGLDLPKDLEWSPSHRESLSYPRGTSPAVSSEEAQAAAQRYLEHGEVWKALKGDDGVKESERPVRLVRLSWLLKLGDPKSSVHREYGGVLPRRQELPEDAFIGVDELRQISEQAKRGVDWYLLVETLIAVQSGDGNALKRVLRFLSDVCTCKFVKRNVDDLLPIVAVS